MLYLCCVTERENKSRWFLLTYNLFLKRISKITCSKIFVYTSISYHRLATSPGWAQYYGTYLWFSPFSVFVLDPEQQYYCVDVWFYDVIIALFIFMTLFFSDNRLLAQNKKRFRAKHLQWSEIEGLEIFTYTAVIFFLSFQKVFQKP